MAEEPELSQKIKDQLGPIQHRGRGGNAREPTRSPGRDRRPARGKWTWGAAAVAEVEDTIVEIDEAIEADAWRLSIDMPTCQISVQIDGSKKLQKLLEFLTRSDEHHPLGVFGELQWGRPAITWVWDEEIPKRLFVWLNRAGTSSTRVVLDQHQADCIRSALAEATRP